MPRSPSVERADRAAGLETASAPGGDPDGGLAPPADADVARAAADDEDQAGTQSELELAISPNQHLFIAGASRSGKTTLLKELIRPIDGRIIVDTKHVYPDFGSGEWGPIVRTPEELEQAWEQGFFQLVWQPTLTEIRNPARDLSDGFSRGLRWILEDLGDPHGEPSVTVVFDEARWAVATQPNPLIEALVCQGMGKGIGVFAASQNAFYVFPNLLSDAVHVFSFRLQTHNDRKKLENDVGGSLSTRLGDHEFMYHRQGAMAWEGPFRLEKG
jgi:ABC-type oligopeptide transport system ATPase subunit